MTVTAFKANSEDTILSKFNDKTVDEAITILPSTLMKTPSLSFAIGYSAVFGVQKIIKISYTFTTTEAKITEFETLLKSNVGLHVVTFREILTIPVGDFLDNETNSLYIAVEYIQNDPQNMDYPLDNVSITSQKSTDTPPANAIKIMDVKVSGGDIVSVVDNYDPSLETATKGWVDDNYLTQTDASSTYLSQTDASSTYLTQTDANSTYLTQTDAGNTYLSQTDANSTYLTQTDAGNTYLSQTDANSTYLTQTDAGNTYLSQTDATNTYLTQTDAGNTYLSQTDAGNTYLTQTDANSTYLTQTDAGNTYLTQTDAENTYLSQTDAGNTYLTQTDANSTYLSQTDATNTYLTQTDATNTYLTQTDATNTYLSQTDADNIKMYGLTSTNNYHVIEWQDYKGVTSQINHLHQELIDVSTDSLTADESSNTEIIFNSKRIGSVATDGDIGTRLIDIKGSFIGSRSHSWWDLAMYINLFDFEINGVRSSESTDKWMFVITLPLEDILRDRLNNNDIVLNDTDNSNATYQGSVNVQLVGFIRDDTSCIFTPDFIGICWISDGDLKVSVQGDVMTDLTTISSINSLGLKVKISGIGKI